ncbi:hypothetical protein D0Z00_000174 [Geotrichum galactomycetum]|uniref:Uncharacterized protein n=1 Tax=Geotrichum galactomycetum TaxID=27317 RepID=A0ACB6VAL1_9ASCO|nr:hypothetical protein D0Z00_000174 [Geotrichum candidum]
MSPQQPQQQQPGVPQLSARAQELHTQMVTEHTPGYLYAQAELQELARAKDLRMLLQWVQELTNAHLVKLAQQGTTVYFSAVTLADARIIKTLAPDEALVYNQIVEAGRNGIWTKTLHARTNLHHNVVARCLRQLEALRHIKPVKAVTHPTRKIYMVAGLEPSLALSGGPWFTDAEIDTEFIESLTNVICRFVDARSYPPPPDNNNSNNTNGSTNGGGSDSELRVYSAGYRDFPTVPAIADFVKTSGVANVDLSLADIKTLCEVCVYDGRLEKIDNGGFGYKATVKTHLHSTSTAVESAAIAADVVDFEYW